MLTPMDAGSKWVKDVIIEVSNDNDSRIYLHSIEINVKKGNVN